MYDPIETELVVALAGGSACSLETKKGDKDNWIERAGGRLPNYVCRIAKEIMKSGRSKSSAIAMAISQVKKWAAGGEDVKADTRAKAAKAVAQWEALKAKSKGKKVVKASNGDVDYIFLSTTSEFNTSIVRQAWERKSATFFPPEKTSDDPHEVAYPFAYIDELWTTHLIVEYRGDFYRIDYFVDTDGDVEFRDKTKVEKAWVESQDDDDDDDADLSDDEIEKILTLSAPVGSPLGSILSMYSKE